MTPTRSPRRQRACSTILALASVLPAAVSAAQSDAQRIAALEQKLAASMAMIEKLSARLEKMEAPAAGTAAPLAADAVLDGATQARPPVNLPEAGTVMQGIAPRGYSAPPLHGFADVGYTHRSQHDKGAVDGFAVGSLDIYLTPSLGERVKSIVELVFEYGAGGHGLATELERLQFGYTFSDALTVWGGRFHTPYGYWNTAFHHGLQIQTAATRPRFVEFEDRGGILPAHAIGIMASGVVFTGTGKFGYDVYAANGNRISEGMLDFNPVHDDNANKLIGANVRYTFGKDLDGLTVGAHAFVQKVGADDASAMPGTTRTKMGGVYAVLDRDDWEIIGEYYRFRNTDLSGNTGTHPSWAGFAQVSYTLPNQLTPYLRWEKAALSPLDRYFAAQDSGRSYLRKVAGLHYGLSPQAVVKFEFTHAAQVAADFTPFTSNEARLQVAIRF